MAPHRVRLAVRATAEITMRVSRPALIALQLAAAGGTADEALRVWVDGVALGTSVLPSPVGGDQHVVHVPAGTMEVRYDAECPSVPVVEHRVSTAERIEGLRPSRYCPSDRVLGLAAAEFGGASDAAATMFAICEHVSARTAYTPSSSGPSTDALETLLTGEGVCRDYAHAVAMLGRARGIATRIASVYAPGLSPMDMHAVVEADIDGVWRVFDATRLAPRHSLARIATGRDAADTAFLTVLDGRAELERLDVSAVHQGDLPVDDHASLVSLP